jgi:hypothetical protein
MTKANKELDDRVIISRDTKREEKGTRLDIVLGMLGRIYNQRRAVAGRCGGLLGN